MRVNSVNYVSILCENFVKFGPVTPELTLLICERQLRHVQKNWRILVEYLQIYWTDFRNLFLPYESTLRADDESVPYFFNLSRVVAMAAKSSCKNVINAD